MICPNCGREISDDSKFCRYCGNSVPRFDEPSEFEQQSDERDPATQEEAALQPEPEPAGEEGGLFKTRLGKILLIVIIACAAACVVIAVLWIRTKNNSNEVLSRAEDYLEGASVEETDYDVNDLSVAQKNMLAPMGALIYSDSDATSGYDNFHSWSEDESSWEPICELMNNWSNSFVDGSSEAYYDGDYLVVSEDLVKESASALYADFDGTLPEATGFSQKDTTQANVYIDGKNYCFPMSDRGVDSREFVIDSWTEDSAGNSTVTVQEYDSDKETLYAAYSFDLVDNTYTDSSEEAIFVYSVSDIERAYLYTPSEENTLEVATDTDYILPESDTRYYSEEELSGLNADELRIARNEIYARHGRKFDDPELQSYFDGKDWYQGTIEPDDFKDDSVLNKYEKENIKTIQSLEGTGTGSTSTSKGSSEGSSGGSSGFSYADLSGLGFGFSSGAGAWGEELEVHSDGSFAGLSHDWDALGTDQSGNEHQGVYYWSEFSGTLSNPTKINDYTYSAKVESLQYENEPGTEEINENGILYEYGTPAGLRDGEECMIYLPSAPISSLPDEFINFLYSSGDSTNLSKYGIYFPDSGGCFFSYEE